MNQMSAMLNCSVSLANTFNSWYLLIPNCLLINHFHIIMSVGCTGSGDELYGEQPEIKVVPQIDRIDLSRTHCDTVRKYSNKM